MILGTVGTSGYRLSYKQRGCSEQYLTNLPDRVSFNLGHGIEHSIHAVWC